VTALCEVEPVVRELSVSEGVQMPRGLDLRVHVHVMRGEVQSDQELEEQGPTGVCDSQESLKASSSASALSA